MALSEVLAVLSRVEDRNFVTAYYGTLALEAGVFSCSWLCLGMLRYALVRKRPPGNVLDSAANKQKLKSCTKVAETLPENKLPPFNYNTVQ